MDQSRVTLAHLRLLLNGAAAQTRVLFMSGGVSSRSVSRDLCRDMSPVLLGSGGAAAPRRELESDMAVSESDTTLGTPGLGEEVWMAPSVSDPIGSPPWAPASTEEWSVGTLCLEL